MSSPIDEFMSSVLPKFKEFVNTVQERLFNYDVSYMYDTNKNKYIDVIDLPERYIVKEYSIDVIKIICPDHVAPYQDDLSKRFENKFNINDIFDCFLFKKEHLCALYTKINSQAKLTFILDNYCNIYIPNLKLYILNNYSKYNLYSFYASFDGVFNLNEYLLIYNGHSDRGHIQDMCSFKSEQLKNNDFKKRFADIHLPIFLKEIKYESMINTVVQYVALSDKYNLSNPQKYSEIIDEKFTVDEITDDETTDDETTVGDETSDETVYYEITDSDSDSEFNYSDSESICDDIFTVDEIVDNKHLEIKLDETFYLVNELISKNKIKDLEYIENKKREIENIEEIRKLKIDNLELKSKISKNTITNNNLTNKVKQQDKIILSSSNKISKYIKKSKKDSILISEKLNEINRLNKLNNEKRNLLLKIKNKYSKINIKYKNKIENLNNNLNKCIQNN